MNTARSFFEELALEWDGQQPPDREQTINRLLEPFDACFSNSGTILDVGTGTGALIPILQERYPGGSIFSIDLAAAMLERARKRCPRSILIQSDVHTLPFSDASFTTVICHNCFPHFQQRETALREMRRVTAPGGSFLILHDISREQVNEIHQGTQMDAVNQDLLPSGEALAQLLRQFHFLPGCVDDCEDHYIVTASAI